LIYWTRFAPFAEHAGSAGRFRSLLHRTLQRPEVVAELHALLGDLGELNEGTSFAGSPVGLSSLAMTPRRLDIVDILIQQINRATFEDGNAHMANVLA
jgi:hypothetical protein